MSKKTTKYLLFNAFAERKPVMIGLVSFQVINCLEHEDGSTHSFNVTGIETSGKTVTVYTQTID